MLGPEDALVLQVRTDVPVEVIQRWTQRLPPQLQGRVLLVGADVDITVARGAARA